MSNNLAISLVIGASVAGAMGGLRTVGSSVRALSGQCESTTEKLKRFSQTATQGMRQAVLSLTGLGSAVLAVAHNALDFESSMADVKKVVNFDTPKQFQEMESDLLGLTRTIPMSASELTKIAAAGGQLGIARKDLKGFTEQIAKMSVAFDMSAEESGDAMAKLANVYKIPIKNIGNLGDAINDLSNSSPAKASEIVRVLGRIGGVAKQFGLTATSATALSGAFIALGKPPEVAGTAINGMLTKLMTADRQGKKFQKALAQMGTSAKQLKKDIEKNGEQAIINFLKRVNKMPKGDQMGILSDLFGLEYGDDVAVLAGNVELLEKNFKQLHGNKYAGSMAKEFAARAATTENSLILLKNSLTELSISIGSVLLPIINRFVAKVRPIVFSVIEWSKKNKDVVLSAIKIGATLVGLYATVTMGFGILGAFTGTLLKLHSMLKFLGKGLVLLGKSFLFIGKCALRLIPTIIRLGIAMMTTPIGLVIGLIGGLVAGFVYLWNHCEGFRKFWLTLWDNVKSIFSTVTDSIGEGFNFILSHFPIIRTYLSTLAKFWAAVWEGIKNTFSGITDWIASKIKWLGTAMKKVGSVISGIAEILGFSTNAEKEVTVNKNENQKKTLTTLTESGSLEQGPPSAKKEAQSKPLDIKPQIPIKIGTTVKEDKENLQPKEQHKKNTISHSTHLVQSSAVKNDLVYNVEFKPVINIQGSSTNTAEQLKQGMKMSLQEFERMLRQVQQNQHRREYA